MGQVKLRFISKTITAIGVFEKGDVKILPREDADKIVGLSSVEVIDEATPDQVEPKPRKKRKKKETE